MQAILAVTVPFFALVLCGYPAARSHTLTPPAQFVPVALVKRFVHPALLLGAGPLARTAGTLRLA